LRPACPSHAVAPVFGDQRAGAVLGVKAAPDRLDLAARLQLEFAVLLREQ
jgi:hypothetical protein